MLDFYEKVILEYIVNECDVNYSVFELDDFESYLMYNYGKNKTNVSGILKRLSDKNLISIKYNDSSKYCLSATPNAKQFIENEKQEKQKYKKFKLNITFLLIFILFFAFFGSFLGTLIYNLIFNRL